MPYRVSVPELLVGCVLVIEDEPLIRSAIAEALRDEGLTAIEAASAEEGWAYIEAGGAVDVVFTEHNLPGAMSGVQFAQRLRAQYPGIPVVVTTGRPGLGRDLDGWRGPLLRKPYNLMRTVGLLAGIAQAAVPRRGDV